MFKLMRTFLTDLGVSLCRAVELSNVLNVEPLDKRSPDLRPETIAEHEPDFVLFLMGRLRSIQEVAADFTNVL